MNPHEIKKEIEKLSKQDQATVLIEVMPALCRELLGDEGCKARMMELFGINCLEELEKRLETVI
jgi:hypothetical protein